MKLVRSIAILEGECYPTAWIWCGNILSTQSNAPICWMLRVRLPWWVRRYSDWLRAEDTYQLVFSIAHFKGIPEKYKFWFTTVGEI